MKVSSAARSLVVLSTLSSWSPAVLAQHHPATTHHATSAPAQTTHAAASVGTGTAQPSAAEQKRMQQQMEAMMREQMKQQEAMLKAQQQMYDQHMQKFREWASAQATPNSLGGLPNSPAAMQQWLNVQKHNKALKKSYDPAYDEYLAYQKQGQSKTHSKPATSAVVVPTVLRVRNAGPLFDGVSVSLLRTVHTKLQTANRDYGGHRMQAIQYVGSALNQLGSSSPPLIATNPNPNANPNPNPNPAGGSISQSQTDLILRDSLLKLRTAHNRLANRTGMVEIGTVNGVVTLNFGAVRGAINAAMNELNVALRVR